jgi:hypothetical protein
MVKCFQAARVYVQAGCGIRRVRALKFIEEKEFLQLTCGAPCLGSMDSLYKNFCSLHGMQANCIRYKGGPSQFGLNVCEHLMLCPIIWF